MKRVPIILPNGATRVLICIDDLYSEELRGRWYNPYRPAAQEFDNVVSLLGALERFYNTLVYPQSSVALRSLSRTGQRQTIQRKEVKRYMSDEIFKTERGEKATFVVQVQFRQNATWQGTVTWAEKNQTSHFRSALELLKMVDEALQSEAAAEGEEKAAW